MTTALKIDRAQALKIVWKKTHRDFKSVMGGIRSILVLRDGATILAPLDDLTDQEILARLSKDDAAAYRAAIAERTSARA